VPATSFTARPFPGRSLARLSLLLALLVAVVLGFSGIFQHELWTPDEPREAEIGREMLAAHFSPLPTLGGAPFVEKPPLFPWMIAGSFALFGVSAGAARIPAALFGIGAVLVAYALGKRAGGRAAGLASAIVLATTAKFVDISHASVNDIALTFFVACGHLAILDARSERRAGRAWLAAGLAAGLAFLTKAWIGPILLAAPPVLAAAFAREWSFLRRAILPLGAAVVGGIALFGLPWVLALAHDAGWGPVKVCLVDNLLGRAVGGAGAEAFGHARGPFYYLSTVPLAFLPWTLALPAALASGVRGRADRARFLALAALAGVLLLSIPSGKRDLYALPLFPAASVLPGVWLSRAGARKLDRTSFVALVLLVALALVAAGVALLGVATGRIDAEPIAAAVKKESLLMFSAMLVGAGLGVAWVAAKPLRASAVAGAFVLLALVFHAAIRPLIDPLKNLKPGALEIARAVPAEEPILAFAPDETTRAVVPFYTGRILVETDEPETAGHLVVTDSAEKKLPEAARHGLVKVADVRLGATRKASVYER
jgi:4-amino-4-deoxy-L-arabinose transferase-like glycosyltransferase